MPCRSVVALAMVLLAGATAVAAELTPRIRNGTLTSALPSVAAVLAGSDPGSAGAWCTGTLVGCRTVVTAAHCVCDGGDTALACRPSPSSRFVYLQHAGIFAVSSIAVEPDYHWPTADVAVVTLADAVSGVRPTPLASATPVLGTSGTVAGYGRTAGGEDYGLKRQGSIVTSACPADVGGTNLLCWRFDGTGANTCNGDSGGPLLVAEGVQPVLAGVTSGGNNDACDPVDESWDVDIAAYAGWLAGVAGEPLDGAACGGLPPAGEAGTTVYDFVVTPEIVAPVTRSFDVPAGATRLRVTLNGTDDGSDVDLAVRAGAAPTSTAADCQANGPSVFGACEIANPAAGTWYATVTAALGGGDAQLTATVFGGDGTGVVAACGDGVREGDEACDGADAAACPGGCTATCTCVPATTCATGRVELRRLHVGRQLRLRARLIAVDGDLAGLDPTTAPTTLSLDDGTHRIVADLVAGSGRWRQMSRARGVWRWRGDAGGVRTVRLRDRVARQGIVELHVRGRDVAGAQQLQRQRTRMQVDIGGRCLAE